MDPDFSDGVFSADDVSEQATFAKKFKQFVEDLEPLNFPLYPLDGGNGSDGADGSLPMLIFWSKQPHPFKLSRMTGKDHWHCMFSQLGCLCCIILIFQGDLDFFGVEDILKFLTLKNDLNYFTFFF